MHHDTQQLPSEMSPDIEMMEVVQGVPVITFSSSSEVAHAPKNVLTPRVDNTENVKPGTSRARSSAQTSTRQLDFRIHYANRSFMIKLPESGTVGENFYQKPMPRKNSTFLPLGLSLYIFL